MVRILRVIDKYAGIIIIFFLSFFRHINKTDNAGKRFLVIKLWAMGDSIVTLSLIKGIRESYKNATVDVLLRNRVVDVYESYPVDHIYNIDQFTGIFDVLKLRRKYDVVFDCEPYFNLSAILSFYLGKERIGFVNQYRSRLYTKTTVFRKDQHMVQNYLDMLSVLGKQYNAKSLEKLDVSQNDKVKVDEFFARNFHGKPVVGLTPGVAESSKNRMWFEERFAELADRLIEVSGCDVIIIDHKDNKEIVKKIISLMKQEAINAMGIFSLKETFYLISKCNIFISNDTGPMHIAAAQGCRTIGLFGPNTPVLWAPFGDGNIAIYKTKLKPAIQNDKGVFKDVDRKGYMGPITVDDVFEAVEKCLP